MGWGDELMALGDAKALHEKTGHRVQIVDRHGLSRWHPLWEGYAFMARPGEPGMFEKVKSGGNCRPYHTAKGERQFFYNKDFRAKAGCINLTGAEKSFASRYSPQVVIEPTIKPKASPNKHWGAGRWADFVALAHAEGIRLTQLGPAGTVPLAGVEWIETPDFRSACAVLSRAKAYVGHEGGLHHAAAALGVAGVVIFGGFTPIELTGYAIHRNLGVTFKDACGMRVACSHCEIEMSRITPSMVLEALRGVLE